MIGDTIPTYPSVMLLSITTKVHTLRDKKFGENIFSHYQLGVLLTVF